MARLTQKIAQGLVQDSHLSSNDTCSVLFVRTDELQFLEHAFMQAIGQSCSAVGFSANEPRASVTFEVQPSRALLRYENMFRDGLFGEKKVERLITIEFSSKVLKNRLGEVAFAGLREETFRDTVTVQTIEFLSSPGIKATYATLPSETFFDRIIEPLVIVGATGVLIYLFFTLRS